MTSYVKDEKGLIHVVDEAFAGGDFTVCGFDFSIESDNEDFGFFGALCNGPSNCAHCEDQIRRMKELTKGVRFTKELRR